MLAGAIVHPLMPQCRGCMLYLAGGTAIRVNVCTGPGYHDQGEESERVLTVDISFRATAGGPARGPECEGAGRVGAHPHRRPAPHTPNTAGPGAGPGHTDCACGASSQHMGIATCRWGRVSRSPGLHGQAVAQACPASQPLSDCPTATRRRSKQVRASKHCRKTR